MSQWIGYTTAHYRDELEQALKQLDPHAHLVFAKDPADLRCRLRDEEPRTVGAIVGLSSAGVSDINLAAALASDRRAREVVLVARLVSGSLRSRAAQAGISHVIDIDDVSFGGAVTPGQAAAPALQKEPTDGSKEALRVTSAGEGTAEAQERGERGPAPIIVFASGRGGVGKTSIVATAASHAAHWGMRVAVCDLDLASGNLPALLGVHRWHDPAGYVHEGRLDAKDASQAGVKAAEGIHLWGPCARPEMAEQVMPGVGELLSLLSQSADLVLVDTSSTCTDAVAQAMQRADRLVFVHGPEQEALLSVARVSALAVRLGVARARIARIENGCQRRMVGGPFDPRAELGLETARAFRVADDGDEVRELLLQGRFDELRELDGDFAHGVAVVLASLLEELACLPDDESARKAAQELRRPRRRALFSRKREVA